MGKIDEMRAERDAIIKANIQSSTLQILELLEQAGISAGKSTIDTVIKKLGGRSPGAANKSERLRAAYERQRTQRAATAKIGLARAKQIQDTRKEEPGMVLAIELPRSKLEYARRILGATGSIARAAAAVGMTPTRLRRQINHMR